MIISLADITAIEAPFCLTFSRSCCTKLDLLSASPASSENVKNAVIALATDTSTSVNGSWLIRSVITRFCTIASVQIKTIVACDIRWSVHLSTCSFFFIVDSIWTKFEGWFPLKSAVFVYPKISLSIYAQVSLNLSLQRSRVRFLPLHLFLATKLFFTAHVCKTYNTHQPLALHTPIYFHLRTFPIFLYEAAN